jgi:arylsulfatase A-like enzyme
MRHTVPVLLFLFACKAVPEPEPDYSELPKTDTFPAFYGSVPKNLLIISIDTFRRDLLDRYGGVSYAPFLDEKIDEGVAMDNHYSCSNWTFPSMMCGSQGAPNIEAGYAPDLRNPGEALMVEYPTLALRLSDVGYHSMLVTSNSWFSADHASDYGFDSSERPDDRRTQTVFSVGTERLEQAEADGYDRWFLHLHIKDPHPPYAPPDEYLSGLESLPEVPYDLTHSDEQYEAGNDWPEMSEDEQALLLEHLLVRYHGEVAWMSDQLTTAFNRLDDEGFLDDTLVVFYNDHGEQFWEHGEQAHAFSLHNEENDGIALLWAKNIVADTWSEPTSHIDIVPTILNLYEVALDDQITGVPLGQATPDRVIDMLAVARLGPITGVLQGGWKLTYRWQTGERELYDVTNDPLELTNLWSETEPHAVALEPTLQERVDAARVVVPQYTPL